MLTFTFFGQTMKSVRKIYKSMENYYSAQITQKLTYFQLEYIYANYRLQQNEITCFLFLFKERRNEVVAILSRYNHLQCILHSLNIIMTKTQRCKDCRTMFTMKNKQKIQRFETGHTHF